VTVEGDQRGTLHKELALDLCGAAARSLLQYLTR